MSLVDNTTVLEHIKIPIFKVETLNGYMITDHEGNYLRRAKDKEIDGLEYLTAISPALLEHAVKAKYGDGK